MEWTDGFPGWASLSAASSLCWVGHGVREEGIRSMKYALSRLHNLFFEIKVIVLMSPEGDAFRL